MAITKIHPIKTTLEFSIDYICDPNKTDEQILISSYKCGYKTAALEFKNTKELSNSSSKNLARHLIQSFMPGEVSPELAHKIGSGLCEEYLKGKYEYVLTTHVDKGHIHNHIIFNNVSFIDGHAYNSNKKSYHQIRNASDEICKNNNLSIADENRKSNSQYITKGKSYKEYQERKHGNSYKGKLQFTINLAVKKARNWEEFLILMKEYGYEIKYGQHIAFKALGQERFTRSKTIGEGYTEAHIKERITSSTNIKLNPKIKSANKSNLSNKVIDISSNDLALKSEGFARWLKLHNLKNTAKSWIEINKDNADINDFYKTVNTTHDELGVIQNKIKTVEKEIQDISFKIKNIATYKKYKNIYEIYKKTNNKDAYFRIHESEIILFEAARESLKKTITKELLSSIPKLKKQFSALSIQNEELTEQLTLQKKKVSEINLLNINLETYLKMEHSKVDEISH